MSRFDQKSSRLFTALSVLILCFCVTLHAASDTDAAYPICKIGREQTPIAITSADEINASGLSFSYGLTSLIPKDVVHTAEFAIQNKNYVQLRNDKFELEQFHFHRPSEHSLNDRLWPLELHFVHRNADKEYLVVGIFARQGLVNEAMTTLLSPSLSENFNRKMDGIDLTKLLPTDRSFYFYKGSLSTPPCTEGVNWVVLKEPIEMSAEQITAFTSAYPKNNRPIQPRHGRQLLRIED